MQALAARRVFTGTEILEGATVRIRDGVIGEITSGIAADAEVLDGLLAPGLVDIQVNGGGGVLFNDTLTIDALRTMSAAHARLGTTGIMATLISDERGKAAAALDAVEQALREGVPGLIGLHLEGPWLSAPRRGVHPQEFLRAMDSADMALLARKRDFPVLVTVAPEQASPDNVRALVAAGLTVSVGHTAAAHEDVEALLLAGATGFTHLFNAMPPLEGRKPGAVGVALASADAWAGLILDGIHVHPLSARVAYAAKTARKLILVTDAMATVGANDPTMMLFGEPIAVSRGALRTANGTLAGAHLDLATAVRNAVSLLGASPQDALRMASLTPAEFLGIARSHGRIAPGAQADLVLLADDLSVTQTWLGGAPVA